MILETFCKRLARQALLAATLAPCSVGAQNLGKELDVPYVPTPQAVVDRMLELARVRPGETVIDLGSGDGRIMIDAASKFGARGFGVEIDPRLVQRSTAAAQRAGVADRITFRQQDLFKTDFHDADVLTIYLLPDVNLALRPKILSELKPGARVVSHDYGMGGWRPDAQETVPVPDKTVGVRKESKVYLWTVPVWVEGEWVLEITANGKTRRVQLSLRQRYQFVSGSVRLPEGKAVPFSRGRINGDELRLVLPAGIADRHPLGLTGHITGDSGAGTAEPSRGNDATWSVRRSS